MRDHEFYRKEWMSEDQFSCFQMLCDVMGGGNHLCGTVKPFSRGIELNTRNFNAATFDFDGLTKAVILAHDRCIRFEICPSGPGMVKLVLFKRQRNGRMFERHPTIEEAIATHRDTNQTSNHIPDTGKMTETLYRLANHIAGSKYSLPDEWHGWADEIESDLRGLISSADAPNG